MLSRSTCRLALLKLAKAVALLQADVRQELQEEWRAFGLLPAVSEALPKSGRAGHDGDLDGGPGPLSATSLGTVSSSSRDHGCGVEQADEDVQNSEGCHW